MAKTFPLNIKISAFDNFSNQFATLGSKLNKFGQQTKNLGQSLSIGLTVPLALIGRQSVQTQLAMEAMESKMISALSSSELATEQIKFLRQEADRMGIDFLSSADAFASFAASATRSGISIEETNEIFKNMAETSVASRLSVEKQGLVFSALSQIAGKGVVSMEELRQQLGDHLPGAVAIGAKAMGKTNAEFIEMVSNGEVLANEFLPKFAKTMRDELGGSFSQAAKASAANLARFNNSINDLKMAISSGGVMDALISVTGQLTKLANAFTNLNPSTQKFIVYFGMATFVLGPILLIFGQMTITIIALIALLPKLALGFAALTAAAPWLLFLGLIGGAVYKFMELSEKVGGVVPALKVLGGVMFDFIVAPLRIVANLVARVWGLFSNPPKFLTDIAQGSMARDIASTQQGNMQAEREKAIFAETAATRALQDRAFKGDKTAIEILLKNAPDGTRTNIKSNPNNNVTIEQGISMETVY